MRVEFSKEFEKAVRKLSGKMLDSVRQAVQEVINAGNIEELTDCKKLVDPEFIYCLRINPLVREVVLEVIEKRNNSV